jgi:hypothetical protein
VLLCSAIGALACETPDDPLPSPATQWGRIGLKVIELPDGTEGLSVFAEFFDVTVIPSEIVSTLQGDQGLIVHGVASYRVTRVSDTILLTTATNLRAGLYSVAP